MAAKQTKAHSTSSKLYVDTSQSSTRYEIKAFAILAMFAAYMSSSGLSLLERNGRSHRPSGLPPEQQLPLNDTGHKSLMPGVSCPSSPASSAASSLESHEVARNSIKG